MNLEEYQTYAEENNIELTYELPDDINEVKLDKIKLANTFCQVYPIFRSHFKEFIPAAIYISPSSDFYFYFNKISSLLNEIRNQSLMNYQYEDEIIKFVTENQFEILDFIDLIFGIYEDDSENDFSDLILDLDKDDKEKQQ